LIFDRFESILGCVAREETSWLDSSSFRFVSTVDFRAPRRISPRVTDPPITFLQLSLFLSRKEMKARD